MDMRDRRLVLAGLIILALLVACSGEVVDGGEGFGADGDTAELLLPTVDPVELGVADHLKVVATTSIMGDVVARVGGDQIELTVLMAPGQDPHSFEPAARDLTAVAAADLVFVNGWDLEEGLVDDLAAIATDVPIVPISAGVRPRTFAAEAAAEADHDEHEEAHGAIDPHVWFALDNVSQWVDNVVTVLAGLDPANASVYAANGAAYQEELAELAQYAATAIAQIPPARRLLVTNHDSLGYLAAEYDFTILGTVIPAFSTLAEPSASDLARIVELMADHELCTLFSETTVADTLAQTISDELAACPEVQVLPLHTGSLGPAGSPASSFIELYRFNIDQLVLGLAPAG